MRRRLVVLFLLVVVISSNFSFYFAYAGFELNQKYISEKLCVNKSRPWMHCNGQCYLMKKLKHAEEKENNHDKQVQVSLFQHFNAFVTTDMIFHSVLIQIISTPYNPLKPIVFTGSVFHPPKVA